MKCHKHAYTIIMGIAVLLLSGLWAGGCATSGSDESAPVVEDGSTVPAEYQETYTQISDSIDAFEASVDDAWDGSPHDVTYGTQLFMAASYRGEGLFSSDTDRGTPYILDQFQDLGIEGMTIYIGYPLLMDDFPRAADYLTFYKGVVNEIRDRGMVLCIETGAMSGTSSYTSSSIAASITSYYVGKTWDDYKTGRASMAATIAHELDPDYLIVGSEPDQEALQTGQPVDDPDNAEELYAYIIQQVKIQDSTMLTGAGVGNWLPGMTDYINGYLGITGLDLLDIHIYPANNGALYNAVTAADLALGAGKKITVSEAWPYKDLDTVGAGASWSAVMERNLYSFWAPVDQKFLRVVTKFAQWKQADYLGPFWSPYFYGYIDYSSTHSLSNSERQAQLESVISSAVTHNALGLGSPRYSSTGTYYRLLIDQFN